MEVDSMEDLTSGYFFFFCKIKPAFGAEFLLIKKIPNKTQHTRGGKKRFISNAIHSRNIKCSMSVGVSATKT
jgi:hypothetical protein